MSTTTTALDHAASTTAAAGGTASGTTTQRAWDTAAQHFLLKYVEDLTVTDDGAEMTLVGLAATTLPHTPGWLTGETPEAQGIETGMPNLPRDLRLPGLDEVRRRARLSVMGPDTVRLTIAPADHPLWSQPATWPGIMTASANGPTDHTLSVDDATGTVTLGFGQSRLVMATRPFAVNVYRGDRLLLRTGQRLRQVAGFPMAPPLVVAEGTISMNLEMGTDEKVYGFGEQFSQFLKNGQQLVLETNDALGTGTGRAYKPVPVWHSTAGYTAFVNTGARLRADVGHVRPSVLGIDLDDEALDLVVLTRTTPRERLRDYTALTGRAHRPALWAFGYWMGRCRYHSAAEMLEVGERMRAHAVPADVLHLDPDWLVVDRLNTDFIWNTDRFGDRSEFIAALRRLGLRLSMWELPYLDPASPLFAEAEAGGHLLRTGDGQLAHVQGTPSPDGRFRALFDLTRPETLQWIAQHEKAFLDDGVAVIKTDFGEGCPDGALAADGTPPNYIHNLYPLRYNGAIYDVIGQLTGRTPLVWGRSGWAGSQRYPGQWGGDAESTVVGMQATLRGGLSYATCAPGLWSHDIGGFYGPELTPGLYVRWTQMGAFSPLMRAHGLRPREPWEFGEHALQVCREWIRLRYSLLPYIWQVAGEVEREGMPFIRPLSLEDPEDPVAMSIDDEYLFGRDVLVAPVMDDTMGEVERRVYVPAGTWYDFVTDEVVEGPRFLTRICPLDRIPVLVRAGAVIPRVEVGEDVRCTDDLIERPWTLHVYGDVADPLAGLERFDGKAVGHEDVLAVVRHG